MSAEALGLRILPYVARSTIKGGFAPGVAASVGMSRGFERFPIGTGKARGTGDVGTTQSRQVTDYGDDKVTYEGSTTATAISPLTGIPQNPFEKTYSQDLKGMISQKLDETYGLNPTFSRVTGTFRQQEIPGAVGALAPGFMQAIMEGGAALSKANLESIAKAAYEGDPNSAVGMLNGQVVGLSKGFFGQDVLSGNVPVGMTFAQRSALKDSLRALAGTPKASGAYTSAIGPDGKPTASTFTGGQPYGGLYSEERPDDFGGGTDDPVSSSSSPSRADTGDTGTVGGQPGTPGNPGMSGAAPGGAPGAAGATGGGPAGSRFNEGGRVGYAMGTPKVTKGFINKDPDSVTDEQSIADNRYTSVPEGTMIMNQPSNDKYEKQLDKLVAEAKRNVKLSDKRPKMIEVALSDGERSIHPEYVAYIEKKKGKGYLEKLNDEGKPEVSRRQAKYGSKIQGAQYGGIQTDRGFVQQFVRPDVPTLTTPQPTQQGFIDTVPTYTSDTTSPKLDDFEIKARDLLEILEGNRQDAYVPKGRSKSGATIGIGFDVGQHSVKDLQKMGFDSSIINKLSPYTMKKGQAAKSFLESNPLSFNDEEIENINTIVLRDKYEKFEKLYPEYAQVEDVGKRAVMFSAYFGGGLQRYKTFQKEFKKAQNMESALRRGLINIIPKGAPEYNRAKKALNWFQEYGMELMPIPKSKPIQNPSATR